MRLIRLYCPDFPTVAELNDAQLHYLKTVLRLSAGSEIEVFDGCGNAYQASLHYPSKKTALLNCITSLPTQPRTGMQVHLGLAVSKPQHWDIALQKATELGVSHITPLLTEFSESKRVANKHAHWQEIIVHACQQSGWNHLPELHTATSLLEWSSRLDAQMQKYMCLPAQVMRLHQVRSSYPVALLIGAEGGLSGAEVTQLLAQGFIATGLGPRILRTETAPLVALSLLQFLAGDLRPAAE